MSTNPARAHPGPNPRWKGVGTMPVRRIAIVGGGPSGALCGQRLAFAGFGGTIFDEHLAWEKPCGGGLTHTALVNYPFLLNGPQSKKLIQQIELISPNGHRAHLCLDHPIVIYSRAVLNGLLLERAERAGCRIAHSRVGSVDVSAESPSFTSENVVQHADFLILASGARNSFFPATRALDPADLEMTLGYFVPSCAACKFTSALSHAATIFPSEYAAA